MNGELRIPSLHLIIDLKNVAMLSLFKKDPNINVYWFYVWFVGANDIMTINIIDEAIYSEAAEAIDGIGTGYSLDTKWKNDLLIELEAFLKLEDLKVELKTVITSIVRVALMAHKSKSIITEEIRDQLAHVGLTPGIAASLIAKLKA